jgi:hypothetical protein
VQRPSVLYHGTPLRLSTLEPRGRHGDLVVYATHERLAATAFALPILLDDSGASWSMTRPGGTPRITITRGRLDVDGVGYVYELALDGFERIDDWQWIARVPITPLAHHVISAREYAHWIAG